MMTEKNKKQKLSHLRNSNKIPCLGEGVYLIEEEYKGKTIYAAYLPRSDYGLQINEPVYRFLFLCSKGKESMQEIIEKMLVEFEVEREELEKDVAQNILRLKELRIIEFNETLCK